MQVRLGVNALTFKIKRQRVLNKTSLCLKQNTRTFLVYHKSTEKQASKTRRTKTVMTFNYTYNSDSHELVFTVDGETEAFKIIKLTDHVMYLAIYENGVLADGMESRKL